MRDVQRKGTIILLIQWGDHRGGILVVCKHRGDSLQDLVRTCNVLRVRVPLRVGLPSARVIEASSSFWLDCYPNEVGAPCLPILAPRSTVKIDNNFDVVGPRPLDGLLKIRKLSRNERLSRADLECPVADGNSNVVKALTNVRHDGMQMQRLDRLPSCRNGPEIVLSDPGVPMLLERFEGLVMVLHLAKRPLIDDVRISGVVEQAWCDPRLAQNTRQ